MTAARDRILASLEGRHVQFNSGYMYRIDREVAEDLIEMVLSDVEQLAAERAAEELRELGREFDAFADDSACGRGSWRQAAEFTHSLASVRAAALAPEEGR